MSNSIPALASSINLETTDYAKPISVTMFEDEEGLEYEYIKYSDPVDYEYDGKTQTVLGIIRPIQSTANPGARDYNEYTQWEVVDNGISGKWAIKNGAQFMASIARGMETTKEYEKTISLGIRSALNIPSSAPSSIRSKINEALKGEFNLSTTYKYKLIVTLKGPDSSSPYNTRSFYYNTGYHKHNITLKEKLYSNWDGLLKTVEHKNCYGYEPACEYYSEDYNA